ADGRDALGLDDLRGKLDRLCQPSIARNHLDLEEGDIRPAHVLDIQRPDEVEDKLHWVADFLKEIDGAAHRAGGSHFEGETVPAPRRKLARDMPVGDNDVFSHEPTSAHKTEWSAA